MGGGGNVEDLNRIFLGLRERFFSCHAFQEVGHFTAHADKRTTGFVSNQARDYLRFYQVVVPNMHPHRPPIQHSVDQTTKALRASLNLCRDDELGFRREVAKSMVGAMSKNLVWHQGRLAWRRPLTDNQRALYETLMGRLRIRPMFTGPELLDQFVTVVQKNRLLRNDEEAAALRSSAGNTIQLYAAWRMHNCQVVLEGGGHTTLRAASPRDQVVVTIDIPSGIEWVYISHGIYRTDIAASVGCSEYLAQHEGDWRFPIYLRDDGKLDRL